MARWFVVLPIIMLIAGCGGGGGGTQYAVDANYYPLAVGSTWTYQFGSNSQTLNVVEAIQVNGETGYYLDYGIGGWNPILVSDEEGVRQVAAISSVPAENPSGEPTVLPEPIIQLQYPLSIGQSWVSIDGPGASRYVTILGVQESIVTPAGTFANCVKAQIHEVGVLPEHAAETAISYYAPGVGLVRTDAYFSSQEDPVVMELISYSLAGGH